MNRPPPSELLDDRGEPLLGTYVGAPGVVDLARAARRLGKLHTISHRKRWVYTAIATEELYLGVAIVDLGYATNAFAFAVGLESGMLADDSVLGAPGMASVGDRPEEGCDAWFRGPGAYVRLSRAERSSAYDLVVSTARLRVYATLDTAGAPSPLLAVAKPLGGDVNVTEKRALLQVRGLAEVNGKKIPLDGALGGFDYTQGFLPRATAWRWAYLLGRSTDGHKVGMNLVEGFNGACECAVWIDSEVVPVGEGRFTFEREKPMDPWSVQTTDGAVDVTFRPVALHAEHRDLVVIQSRFVQPVGAFYGTLRIPGHMPLVLEGAPGVVEDQRVRW